MTEVNQADREAAADMVTKDHLKRAILAGECDELPAVQRLARHAAQARREALREAVKACEEQRESFLSPDYAVNQPLSSFSERFACSQCADAILSLNGAGQ